MAAPKVGRPELPDDEKKKVRSVRISDLDLERILQESGSLQEWIDSMISCIDGTPHD